MQLSTLFILNDIQSQLVFNFFVYTNNIVMSYLANNYNRKKISFTKGKGSYLYTSKGVKYLDFVQGIAVNCLGHAHPKLVQTIQNQSKKLWHISNAFKIPEGEKLAKKLCQKTFADYVIFQNSGAEATEASIKVCLLYTSPSPRDFG